MLLFRLRDQIGVRQPNMGFPARPAQLIPMLQFLKEEQTLQQREINFRHIPTVQIMKRRTNLKGLWSLKIWARKPTSPNESNKAHAIPTGVLQS